MPLENQANVMIKYDAYSTVKAQALGTTWDEVSAS